MDRIANEALACGFPQGHDPDLPHETRRRDGQTDGIAHYVDSPSAKEKTSETWAAQCLHFRTCQHYLRKRETSE